MTRTQHLHQQVIARFEPSPNGKLRFKGVHVLRKRIAAKPVTSRTHIAFIVPAAAEVEGGARQESVAIDSIGRWYHPWCPKLVEEP